MVPWQAATQDGSLKYPRRSQACPAGPTLLLQQPKGSCCHSNTRCQAPSPQHPSPKTAVATLEAVHYHCNTRCQTPPPQHPLPEPPPQHAGPGTAAAARLPDTFVATSTARHRRRNTSCQNHAAKPRVRHRRHSPAARHRRRNTCCQTPLPQHPRPDTADATSEAWRR
eukprot:358416-Chlamydomonas_euryale.AAC.3